MDYTTEQTPIPHTDLFEINGMFSKSLAWMEAQREMIQQLDRPSTPESCFS